MTALRQRQTRAKRVRPPMPPLAVRVIVAEREYAKICPFWGRENCSYRQYIKCYSSLGDCLKWLLSRVFEDGENVAPHALDHDPALILRAYNPRIKDVAARYTPHAHDPDYLIYRAKDDHQRKTTGRKPGAERTITTKGSDIGLATKFRRLENPKKRKKTWPKRKFGGKKA